MCIVGDKPEIGAPIEAVVLGETSTLKCKATGKPTLCYTWLFNDVVTHEANHPEFTIESVNESHQGEYKCRVSNDIGFSVSEPATLTPGEMVQLYIGIKHYGFQVDCAWTDSVFCIARNFNSATVTSATHGNFKYMRVYVEVTGYDNINCMIVTYHI